MSSAPSEIQPPKPQSYESGVKFPQWLLNVGFGFALFLAVACLSLSAIYLYNFLASTNSGLERLIADSAGTLKPETLAVAINARLLMARLALTSCGIFVGVSFAFLGFALFLLGIRKESDATVGSENFQAKFVRLSPGILIMICATVLVSICVTREIYFYNVLASQAIPVNKETKTATPSSSADLPSIPSDPKLDDKP